MYLLKIAARNLTRNKLRTFISIVAVTAVVMIVIFARGLMVGFTESSFGMYIDNNFGHVRITDSEYQLREPLLPLDYTVDGFAGDGVEEMLAELRELDKVEHVLPRIRFGAMASIDDNLLRMIGVGIDPAAESDYGFLAEEIKKGRMPQTENEILVGQGLLADLGAELEDRVTLMFVDAYQSLQGRTFQVVGIRDSGVPQLDDNFFYLPLETAQNILWFEDEVTEVLVFGADARRADALQTEINFLLAERSADHYSTVLWNKADPLVETYDEVGDIMNLVYILFILMGTVVIISTLTMIIRERTSEIGMMAALGLRGRDIMKIFILEGAFMGLIGSLLGVVGGGLITFYYSRAGLHVEAFAEALGEMDVLIEPVFYLAFNFENLVVSFIMGVVIVTLACLYPAYQAAKLEPAAALHYIDE
ncbi:ABC transporter permease [Fuchsiella alkaliacetigena]|uniref:ABC transporter permease n=1 Tax=Fuchsiella alkaliacetigena TaxID=957042 RepID=UPI002009FEE9|nr:FtsX-like permease family protein [Fuchsiella alkaliacetigena]MCK8824145.1 ABC transporter permease [Fuchsiella alkaliacetigena]